MTSQLIGRGRRTFTVEHAVNMVTLPVTVDRRGDKGPGRQDPGTTAKPKDALQVRSVADCSVKELE